MEVVNHPDEDDRFIDFDKKKEDKNKMCSALVHISFYNITNKIKKTFREALRTSREMALIRDGYKYNDNETIYIGQNIKVEFDDTFGNYKVDMFVIDIIIEDKENFGLLLVPENHENMFPGNMNEILSNMGFQNLRVPKDGCFFAKHISRGKFSFELERKNLGEGEIEMNVTVPKMFNLPEDSIRKIVLYKKMRSKELPFSISRLLE